MITCTFASFFNRYVTECVIQDGGNHTMDHLIVCN